MKIKIGFRVSVIGKLEFENIGSLPCQRRRFQKRCHCKIKTEQNCLSIRNYCSEWGVDVEFLQQFSILSLTEDPIMRYLVLLLALLASYLVWDLRIFLQFQLKPISVGSTTLDSRKMMKRGQFQSKRIISVPGILLLEAEIYTFLILVSCSAS